MLIARFALVALPLFASQGLLSSKVSTVSGGATQNGTALGGLHGPHLGLPGQIRGQILDLNGELYTAIGQLDPAPLDAVDPSGYTPVGTLYGVLVPTVGTGAVGYVEFFGHYSMTPRGTGEFNATLFRNATSLADPGKPLGEWTGRFEGANQFSPATDTPLFGAISGVWSLTL